MRFKRTAAVAGTAFIIGAMATSAFAATATIGQTVVDPNSSVSPKVSVTSSGWTGLNTIYMDICYTNDVITPDFTFGRDCALSSGYSRAADAAGVLNIAAGNLAAPRLLNGNDPNGGRGCGPLTSSGNTQFSTCYLRFADNTKTNNATDVFVPYTFSALVPGNEVPEVPLNVLLPISATAIIAGAVVVTRRRSARA